MTCLQLLPVLTFHVEENALIERMDRFKIQDSNYLDKNDLVEKNRRVWYDNGAPTPAEQAIPVEL